MSTVQAISAPRRVVDFVAAATAAEASPDLGLLPQDQVSLSPEARKLMRDRAGTGSDAGQGGGAPKDATSKDAAAADGEAKSERSAAGGRTLTTDQQQEVQKLQARDQHVRAHEAAHQAAGGELTGAVSFSYETGPDGRTYAVGGEVPVQARAGRSPEETIAIAQRVRAAALAPADPSTADLAAAAVASQMEQQARAQARAQQGAKGGAPRSPSYSASLAGVDLERLVVKAPEGPGIF